MFTAVYHLEVTIGYVNEDEMSESDYEDDKYYNLLDEFEEKYKCVRENQKKEMPCNAVLAHGVYHGLCFEFINKKDVVNAYTSILETEWFVEMKQKYPKFSFNFDVDNVDSIRGLTKDKFECDINGNIDMNSEWNQFVKASQSQENK